MKPLRPMLLMALWLAALVSAARGGTAEAAADTAACRADTAAPACRVTVHEWLYGAGCLNVLDTYLSPLEYTGPALSALHRSLRTARFGAGRVEVEGLFLGHAALLSSPTGDHRAWDASFSAAVAWRRRWHPLRRLRLSAGGTGEAAVGFTYLNISGNNPAQGRLALTAGLSVAAEWQFAVCRSACSVASELGLPLLGARFTPAYGQSYYELFSLGHYDRNVRFTHPFNAPSLRWLTAVRLPLLGARLSVAYLADVRQARQVGLKHHAWHNALLVGYVRHLQLLRPVRRGGLPAQPHH